MPKRYVYYFEMVSCRVMGLLLLIAFGIAAFAVPNAIHQPVPDRHASSMCLEEADSEGCPDDGETPDSPSFLAQLSDACRPVATRLQLRLYRSEERVIPLGHLKLASPKDGPFHVS